MSGGAQQSKMYIPGLHGLLLLQCNELKKMIKLYNSCADLPEQTYKRYNIKPELINELFTGFKALISQLNLIPSQEAYQAQHLGCNDAVIEKIKKYFAKNDITINLMELILKNHLYRKQIDSLKAQLKVQKDNYKIEVSKIKTNLSKLSQTIGNEVLNNFIRKQFS